MDTVKNTLSFQEVVTICQIQKLDMFVLTFFTVFSMVASTGDCLIMTRSLILYEKERFFLWCNQGNLFQKVQ